MDPLLLASIVQAGGGLLGGLFGGASKAQEAKLQLRNAEALKQWEINKAASTLKPTTSYYQSPYLPALGETTMRAIMGNLAQRMGPDLLSKWGINTAAPFKQTPAVGPTYPAPQAQPADQNLLLKKYGLSGGGAIPGGGSLL